MDTGIVEFAMHFILVARSGQDFQERFDASDGGVVIRRQEHSGLNMSPGVARRLSGIVPIRTHACSGTRPEMARPSACGWAQYIDAEATLLGLADPASDEVPNGARMAMSSFSHAKLRTQVCQMR